MSAAEQVRVLHAVYQVIAGSPEGAPAGVIYAGLMQHGCTLAQYESIEAVLVRTGLVEKKGDLLFARAPGGTR